MHGLRVLVAEDEQPVRELLAHHLTSSGLAVLEAQDGPLALRIARDGVDLVLLDIGLPLVDGLEVARRLRLEGRSVPVIMLSGRADEIDRIVGFELGADDYVTKPFSVREVILRVRAVLRRSSGPIQAAPRILRFGRLEIDEAAREARFDGTDVRLKPREFELLLTLARNAGVALSRAMLLERVWGYDFDGDSRTVDVHIRRLRMKVEPEDANGQRYLHTVHGFGYKFAAQ
jgi:DNA-binding response OmpR family regulator